MKIYGDPLSGNCLKVKWVCDHLGLDYQWIDIDILKGETRSAEFLALNPTGQVPAVTWDDGRALAQSNAIIRYLAQGSSLIPQDDFIAAKMDEWLNWEQYSHEPNIATTRFHVRYQGRPLDQRDTDRVKKGAAALELMNIHLENRAYFVGGQLSLADIALVAYTRVAHEGGFDLNLYPHVQNWVNRVERDLSL